MAFERTGQTLAALRTAFGGQARRRPRATAAGAAVLLHALLLLIFVQTTAGTTLAGAQGAGEGDMDVVLVSLAGLKGGPAAATSASAAPEKPAELQSMFDRLRADDSPLKQAERADPQPNAAELMDALDRQRAKARADARTPADQAGDGGAANRAGAGQGRNDGAADRDARTGTAGLPSDALFAQVERCWKRLPGSASVPVTLEVVIDDRGRLAVPPKILRADAAALNERRLAAEARAIQALAACTPYRPAAPPGGRRSYRLEFRPGR